MTNPIRDGLREHFVYRLWDADGVCLYVGCTVDLPKRLMDHLKYSRFAGKVATDEISRHANMAEALRVELAEIRRLRPRHNIMGRGPRRTWTQCDYFEVLEHFSGDPDVEANSVTFHEVLAEFRGLYPDTAAATLPALGIAS